MLEIDQDKLQLMEEIRQLKKQRNAVILAHLYQRPEVQEVADFVGDSLALSQKAAETDADVIVFCGVHFMAESAAILSPDKIVLLPEEKAGCPMADMVTAEALRQRKQELPNATVVCYVNSSAEVKAESDICCTSANAAKVVQSLPEDAQILFIPDRNLGHWVQQQTGREIVLWEGYCNTHERLTAEDIHKARAEHPEAVLLVHPECRPDVVELADGVFSTAGMIKYAKESSAKEFILGTESGILHEIQKACPDKTFYMASNKLICPNMKSTTLPKVKWALEDLEPRITVPEDIRNRAIFALEKMLAIK